MSRFDLYIHSVRVSSLNCCPTFQSPHTTYLVFVFSFKLSWLVKAMIESRRKPRPCPIQVPKLVGRQERENVVQAAEKTPPLSPAVQATSSHTQSESFTRGAPASDHPSNVQGTLLPRTSLRPSSTITTPTSLQTTTLRIPQSLLTPSTTRKDSPTVTTVVTVTQSFSAPGAEPETPEADEIVFISQRVTVTVAAPQVTAQADSKGNPPVQIIPSNAKVPLIVISVLGAIAAVVALAIVIWRRRAKKKKQNVDIIEKS
ncbi:hypothetical protein BU24DRAFT_473184 [Aaosphaeria arxii CBS 175.79]|uniref:Uncharacterized protein n=1 Tax=Aaosphaeria arxii CBS 175.79 TaxID=1450172 RepID=A0A6A5XAB7_9PLEO|nr:uncharacterized protein BU24DRAFT_473184 [Aaosphaeria arxii CBS 175.79]KAF2010005.1 hypothetical protein BU24DRAFT_473184 [Aaosphaeria arxii CBS 175.79]